MLQARIWEHQPAGIFSWHVQPMNVHDEIMAPMKPEVVAAVSQTVSDFIEEMKETIPLIGIDWNTGIDNWTGKESDGENTIDKLQDIV